MCDFQGGYCPIDFLIRFGSEIMPSRDCLTDWLSCAVFVCPLVWLQITLRHYFSQFEHLFPSEC